MIDPAYIWPDDRFEVLSRLSTRWWTSHATLLTDLGWSRERLAEAIREIRGLQVRLRCSKRRDAVKISPRSASLVLVAIRGFEERMDDAEMPSTWSRPGMAQFESESMK